VGELIAVFCSGMKFGIAIFPTDYSISMQELAPAVEERGFDSLWVAEHSHIPTSRATPYPSGGELPKQYADTFDPFIALTVAATATSTLRVGTGICLVIQRDPIDTAKSVATLDRVSGGRVLFGVGGGWNREEIEDHGTPFAARWKVLRERVEAMRALWTQEAAEYHGEHVSFDPAWAWPKPVQKPHPPVLLGGNGPNTIRRVVRYCDGWMPNRGDYLARIPELRRLAEDAGRGPLPVSAYPRTTDAAVIEEHRAAGVERCIFYVPSGGRDAALTRLEELTTALRVHQQA
jgi:probable F420-dependent oxidoreductase